MKTVMEQLKAAGFDPDLAATIRGAGNGRCDGIEISRISLCRPDCIEEQVMVQAAGKVDWSDGTHRAFPSSGGWKGSEQYCVTMFFRLDKLPPALISKKVGEM